MSIDYFAVTAPNTDLIGPLVEPGSHSPVDEIPGGSRAVTEMLLDRLPLAGDAQSGKLRWERGDTYLFVTVTRTGVHINHGTTHGTTHSGEELVDLLTNLFNALADVGLHIYDPQQGTWVDESHSEQSPDDPLEAAQDQALDFLVAYFFDHPFAVDMFVYEVGLGEHDDHLVVTILAGAGAVYDDAVRYGLGAIKAMVATFGWTLVNERADLDAAPASIPEGAILVTWGMINGEAES